MTAANSPDEAAATAAAANAAEWLRNNFGDDLNGKQIRTIVQGLITVLHPHFAAMTYTALARDFRAVDNEYLNAFAHVVDTVKEDFLKEHTA